MTSKFRTALLFMLLCLAGIILAGCASTTQTAPIASGPVAADKARIIVSRPSQAHGTAARFAISDSGTQIGEIGPGGQLVWDRIAGPMALTALNTLVTSEVGRRTSLQVEVGGSLTYQFRVYHPFTGHAPVLELVSGTPVPSKQIGTVSTVSKEEEVRPASVTVPASSATVPAAAVKNIDGKFKTIEVRHFSQVDGLGLSQIFVNSFYDGLREGLIKLKIAEQVVDEGAMVSEADAVHSVVVEGKFTDYREGGFLKGPGMAGLEIRLSRRSDHALISTITPGIPFKSSPLNTDTGVGKNTGQRTAYEIRNALK